MENLKKGDQKLSNKKINIDIEEFNKLLQAGYKLKDIVSLDKKNGVYKHILNKGFVPITQYVSRYSTISAFKQMDLKAQIDKAFNNEPTI